MIVGCYSMDLYCARGLKCERIQPGEHRHGQDTTTGQTAAQCKTEARRKGWRFTRDGDVLCPWCVRAGQRLAQ